MPVKRSANKAARDESWDIESSVLFWINHTSRTVLRLHESRLRPLGLSMGQLPVLIALQEHGALSQKDLVLFARVEQPTMAELLLRMERDGVIQRTPNPEDKRGNLTSLTRSGRARLAQAKAALLENEAAATASFNKKEKATLRELLQRVLRCLEEGAGEAMDAPRRRAT